MVLNDDEPRRGGTKYIDLSTTSSHELPLEMTAGKVLVALESKIKLSIEPSVPLLFSPRLRGESLR
jgi:hypothetical protein